MMRSSSAKPLGRPGQYLSLSSQSRCIIYICLWICRENSSFIRNLVEEKSCRVELYLNEGRHLHSLRTHIKQSHFFQILRWTGLVRYSYTPLQQNSLTLLKTIAHAPWTLVAADCSACLPVRANQRWQAAGLNLTSARLTHLMSHPDSEVHVLHGNSSPSTQQFPAQRIHLSWHPFVMSDFVLKKMSSPDKPDRQQCQIWHCMLSTFLLHGKAARFQILFSFVQPLFVFCYDYKSILKVIGMTPTYSSNKNILIKPFYRIVLVFLAMLATRHNEWRWHLVCGPTRNMSIIMQWISDAGIFGFLQIYDCLSFHL